MTHLATSIISILNLSNDFKFYKDLLNFFKSLMDNKTVLMQKTSKYYSFNQDAIEIVNIGLDKRPNYTLDFNLD